MEKMKEEKQKAEQEKKVKEKERKKKFREKRQKRKEEETKDLERRLKENQEKRRKEQEEKKKKEDLKKNVEKELEKRKKEKRKEFFKARNSQMKKVFNDISKQRKGALTEEEEQELKKKSKKEKEANLKQYFDKQKELKAQNEAAKKEYLQFYESDALQKTFEEHFDTISESYLKFAKEQKYTTKSQPGDFKMTFAAFKKFGHDMRIYPNILSFDDLSHIFKMIVKEKADKSKSGKAGSKVSDKDTLNITFNEFKDALTRIACLAKYRLGGLKGVSDEETKEKDQELRNYLRTRWHKAATGSIAKEKSAAKKGDSVNSSMLSADKKDLNSSTIANNKQTNRNNSVSKPNADLNSSGRVTFDKSKKMTKAEKERQEREHALSAAKSFSIGIKRDKSVHRGSSIPPVIYEDTELQTFPEIDAEHMTSETVEVLINYLKDVLQTEKSRGDTSKITIQKAPNQTNTEQRNPSNKTGTNTTNTQGAKIT